MVSAEADVLAGPVKSCESALTRLVELTGHGIAVPPELPKGFERIDQTEADRLDESPIYEAGVTLAEDRHVADPLKRPPAALIGHERGRTDLYHVQLRTGVPGTCLVAGRSDALAPVLRPEDHEPADGVAHHLPIDAIEAGVADERALAVLHHVDAPADRRTVCPLIVEPLVLALLGGGNLPPEVARDSVVLHAAVCHKRGHILTLQWGEFNSQLTRRKTHDRSESHELFLSVRTSLYQTVV